jgi:hypothetical protein
MSFCTIDREFCECFALAIERVLSLNAFLKFVRIGVVAFAVSSRCDVASADRRLVLFVEP